MGPKPLFDAGRSILPPFEVRVRYDGSGLMEEGRKLEEGGRGWGDSEAALLARNGCKSFQGSVCAGPHSQRLS